MRNRSPRPRYHSKKRRRRKYHLNKKNCLLKRKKNCALNIKGKLRSYAYQIDRVYAPIARSSVHTRDTTFEWRKK